MNLTLKVLKALPFLLILGGLSVVVLAVSWHGVTDSSSANGELLVAGLAIMVLGVVVYGLNDRPEIASSFHRRMTNADAPRDDVDV